ncbi:unnamed protein product, partial [Vitrella brassicaformis CCMP3155]
MAPPAPSRAEDPCEICIKAKSTQLPPAADCDESPECTRPFELVHTDICGPMPNSSPGGFQYFITYTDEYTKMVAVYMLRTRDESAAALRRLCGEWGKTPETIRSDWAQELSAGSFEQECIDRGIKRQFSAPYTPRENGVAERMNRTLLEKGTALLLCHGITKAFWPFAMDTAAYLRNRMPTESLSEDKTPYEMWHGRRPYLGHVRVWGCLGCVHVRKPFRAHKFAARAVPMLLIGYDGRTKDAYRMWNPKTRRVIISRDVRFLEKRTWHRRLVPASWEATHRLGEPLQARPELVDDHAQRGDGPADLAHQSARRGDVIVNPESDLIVAEKPEIRDVEPDELEEVGNLDQQGHVQAGGDESYDGPSGAGDVQMDGQPRASNPEHDHMDVDGMDANPASGPAAPQPSDADMELMPIDEGEMALDRRAPPPPPPRRSGRERLIPRRVYEDHLFDVRAVQV